MQMGGLTTYTPGGAGVGSWTLPCRPARRLRSAPSSCWKSSATPRPRRRP
ncbi:hypothetical protein P4U99_11675 [Brevibacillus agri]|nr:hypothetical protein [Brevibacillus agri]MCG5250656.1 hypothetical protein [Brevibacillus agri]MED1643830.1 hypothetical protein [Brevibacillus agri]MED1657270.1 hypothetical protein [Brevibacillus agri]MED1697740.1 hypothetical protein [Brevibacillus agri]MED1701495.1 hypothetical protein [Brevibacillus agri]